MASEESKIFISYSRREDGEFALKLGRDLRAAGVNIWMDQLDIPAGARWDHAVESALRACRGLLVILSPASVENNNVMDEVSYALEERKQVLPVLHRRCTLPFRLRRLQYSDFTTDYEKGLIQLLRALGVDQALPEPATETPDEEAEAPGGEGAGASEEAAEKGPTTPAEGQQHERSWISAFVTSALVKRRSIWIGASLVLAIVGIALIAYVLNGAELASPQGESGSPAYTNNTPLGATEDGPAGSSREPSVESGQPGNEEGENSLTQGPASNGENTRDNEPPSKAIISFTSSPGGADVYVDGIKYGRTDAEGNLRIERAPGEVELKVSKEGYETWHWRGTVSAGSLLPLSAPLGEEPRIFTAHEVDQQPEPVDGTEAIQQRVRYPEAARAERTEGIVHVQFIVDEEGKVRAPEVQHSVQSDLDREAVRVVRETEFEPGRHEGRPVKVRMSLSVSFNLPTPSSVDVVREEARVLEDKLEKAVLEKDWSDVPDSLIGFYENRIEELREFWRITDASVEQEPPTMFDDSTATVPVTLTITYEQKGREIEKPPIEIPSTWTLKRNNKGQWVLDSVEGV